jgi:hypothetical protein
LHEIIASLIKKYSSNSRRLVAHPPRRKHIISFCRAEKVECCQCLPESCERLLALDRSCSPLRLLPSGSNFSSHSLCFASNWLSRLFLCSPYSIPPIQPARAPPTVPSPGKIRSPIRPPPAAPRKPSVAVERVDDRDFLWCEWRRRRGSGSDK